MKLASGVKDKWTHLLLNLQKYFVPYDVKIISLEVLVIDIIECANISNSEMIIGKEWNDLFNFLFHSNICLYAHRRDDIGFHIGWLYQIYMSSIDNSLFVVESSVVREHLYDLLFFLQTTTKEDI